MELLQTRYKPKGKSTGGELFEKTPEGKLFFQCYTLDDLEREHKIYGETAIPRGRYEIKLRKHGRLHGKYADRFPEIHEGMLWLQDVENFEWIYIHCGTTIDHTDGCILVGEHLNELPNGNYSLQNSSYAYVALYKKIIKALNSGERVFITVI